MLPYIRLRASKKTVLRRITVGWALCRRRGINFVWNKYFRNFVAAKCTLATGPRGNLPGWTIKRRREDGWEEKPYCRRGRLGDKSTTAYHAWVRVFSIARLIGSVFSMESFKKELRTSEKLELNGIVSFCVLWKIRSMFGEICRESM